MSFWELWQEQLRDSESKSSEELENKLPFEITDKDKAYITIAALLAKDIACARDDIKALWIGIHTVIDIFVAVESDFIEHEHRIGLVAATTRLVEYFEGEEKAAHYAERRAGGDPELLREIQAALAGAAEPEGNKDLN